MTSKLTWEESAQALRVYARTYVRAYHYDGGSALKERVEKVRPFIESISNEWEINEAIARARLDADGQWTLEHTIDGLMVFERAFFTYYYMACGSHEVVCAKGLSLQEVVADIDTHYAQEDLGIA